jgi:hypothetical protein
MNRPQLERECRTYAQYLIGQVPTPYVINRYIDFHHKSDAMRTDKSDRFDEFLVSVSARTPSWARLADTYASMLRKDSVVRKKLVLTLALLESAPPSFETLERVDGRSTFLTFMRLGWKGAAYLVTLAASLVVFTPILVTRAWSWKTRPTAVMER